MKKLRILIADDHEIVRRGLRPLIESEWGWEICGEAANGREALAMAEKLKPEIVVLDVAMPELNGVDVTRLIKRALPQTEILAFTGYDSEKVVHQLFAAGALGCVLKTEADQHLIAAIKSLAQHKPFFGSRAAEIIFETYRLGGLLGEQSDILGLSRREREVVQLLAEGKSNKDVARILGVSVRTAETHRIGVMRKLGLRSFAELVRYAVRNEIVGP